MRQTQKPQDFEKFYYRYVANGEGCGCAERIIDVNEFNRLAGPRKTSKEPRSPLWQKIKAYFWT